MPQTKILVLGATGYIGGSVLTEMQKSKNASDYSISALVRKAEQAAGLRNLAVSPIVFEGLDDLLLVKQAASQNDIVINAASASHDKAAVAIIQGLAERKRATGQAVSYIHTSGTSILSDRPVSGKEVDLSVYSDKDTDIYKYETARVHYSQRATDIAVVEAGEQLGVPTYIVVPPTIYGEGSGPFSTISQQVPNLVREAMRRKQAVVIGAGSGIWNHVHILDLAPLYTLILQGILSNEQEIPHGRKGFFFAETGEHTWLEVSQGIANACFARDLCSTTEVKSIGLAEAASIIGGSEELVEIVLASNSRSRADLGRELGWKPARDNADFREHFDQVVEAVAAQGPLVTLAALVGI
ncbi:NAD dependent epimerase/dehydratase family protein [Metarhizium album ARSEF 1941]|uniref:NAD dependent epimerase/dehydratase family protein n=1 Tax=Metarhizium album (strain ARSEF 1941) TaxID=1081103 RepID=A0A0B2WZI2_METAS|nr:NAD dependent epimerase/dehydratase family protein [Metarhizium album ARSEF 1941]KHN98994.1 NAD dependent epimerase/dehydratase family protein [Metarhizium album ARSEF 1941]